MAEDGVRSVASRRESFGADEGDSAPSMLLQKLKSNISKSIQCKVDSILQDVQRFSDNDKLYLYLQLPSGPGAAEKSSSSSDSSSFNVADQLHTCNWIRSHLEEHADTCLPKQDVYEAYKRYCDNLHYRPLSAANFGKIIRDIFPNIKARRLGGRGQSKYCYSGIRRKTVLSMPLLPSLDLKNDPSELTELVQTYKQEVTEAACELICNWAEKILKRSFDTVVEIARFLVQEHIVNPRCSQAELVTSATLAGGPAKPHKVMKKTPALPKGGSADGEGSGSENKKDRDGGEQASPSKATSAEKQGKGADSGKTGGRDLQVEAAMKRFPLLLPRRPDKALLPVRSLPPAPKDMKVTLPITMPTTLPVMILPSGMSLSYHERERPPPAVTVPATPAPGAVQRSRAAPKRTAEPVSADGAAGGAGTPPKRKRGRPRKPRPEETAQPAPTTPTPVAAVPVSGGVIQKALPASAVPSQQPRPEVMELVIQEDSAPATVLDLGTEDAGGASHRLLTLQHNATGATSQAMPYPVLLLPGASHPLKTVVSPGWEGGRAAVEVIRRAPVARENRSQAEAPAAALDTLLENKEVEITLTPVDSLSEPLLTSEAESDCPQPGASGQANIP
nr:DNA-binding protein RFX5 isoform X1 [Paramormyrops kingsleyae]XP_023687884.1 DNA-binding protein RFX5 isoform X1 [Paramormyrops kingsleyae]XP_023687885.1 DNA-binding protein RFX5 isoform X1 [Paramormyrops kingsleyae]XP_023687886.1 DNA-binding protein RFX5 isoform X1 [Paramormyrops kingsleyae]XP_023687887.1 DNA-binding protein RFX5 isoform X1 [Paramormyrops kingsleyae]